MLVKNWLANNALLLATIGGVVAGIGVGFGLRSVAGGAVSGVSLQIIAYPGELFMRALQLVILPLVMSSLLVGSASLNASANGKIAIRTLSYFFTTSLFNAIFGVLIVVLVHPGDPSSRPTYAESLAAEAVIGQRKNTLLDNILDLGRNLVPANIFTAMFQQTQTVYEKSAMAGGDEFHRTIVLRDGTNTLGVITFALIFGMVLGTLGHRPQARALIESFRVIDEVIMKIVTGVMWLTPVGVGSLIAAKILSVDDLVTTVTQLGRFILTVTSGLMFSQLVLSQVLYFVVVRKNPFRFYAGLLQATITGFATSSAAVALPISFRCMEKLRVDPRISHFVLPIGTTINKDGTALFQAVSVIFIAQMNGVELGFGNLATVAIAATIISMASPAIPSSSLAIMPLILNAIGLPTTDVGLIFAVDWLVDRVRTTNNLLGDCYCAAIVEHFSQRELRAMDADADVGRNRNGHVGVLAGNSYSKQDGTPQLSEVEAKA